MARPLSLVSAAAKPHNNFPEIFVTPQIAPLNLSYYPPANHYPMPLRMPKRKIENLPSGQDTTHRKRPQVESIRSPPLPPSKSDTEAPMVMSAGLAFRISRIPSRITRDQFLRILHTLPYNTPSGETVDQRNVLGWSFAPSASSAESGTYNTATVTFGSLPIGFRFRETSITLDIGLIPNKLSIVVDKQFYGLTSLYSSENPLVE